MSDEDFFEDLIKSFPILKTDIEEEDRYMIYMRMEVFAGYTNKLIEENKIPEITKCFDFLESKIDLMSDTLKNALNVSYCEALLLGKNANIMAPIVRIMPTKLSIIYAEYEQYYEDICKRHLDSGQ
ncbi:DUF7674 family protein [Pedobacter miscanthi]|uniref:DUF7674 domain-containing protein n=1 Tax=Pedobacter miscanthi TaxID=2259170 RepID=A0A366KRM9_9SPHI|nr:hypothetical protein [Pedobacter miscanthi]RBQ04291.1 hypothetical protein DRW42_19010 [Pedobacter miscanthi]